MLEATRQHVVTNRSWTLIADELGLTREALYRTLAKLERQQQINRQPDAVYLSSSFVLPLAHLITDGATRNGDAKNSAA